MGNCPITGKPCDKARNIRIQKIVEGEEPVDIECCQDCGKELMGPLLPTMIPLGIISPNSPAGFNLMNVLNVLNAMQQAPKVETCECGSTLRDVQQKGIGCPQCYTVFGAQLMQVIPRVQAGAKEHIGKEPKFANLESMRKHMAKAVREERYEEAAMFRDRIRELEKTLNGNESKTPQ